MSSNDRSDISEEQVQQVVKMLDGDDARVGYGRLTTYGSIGAVTGLVPRQVGFVCSRLGSNPITDRLPLHRIVGALGKLPDGYPDRYHDRLRAEGHTVSESKPGEWTVDDFEDCLA